MSSKTTVADLEKRLDDLQVLIENLESLIARMAHLNGTQNILKEFGIEKWVPGKKDMNRYSDG